mgnify:CR=1 FL=1
MHHYTMDDIDLDSLHRYRNHFKVRNDGHVWNETDDKTFLKDLGGYIVDRETGEEGLSMAGLLRLPIEQIYEGGNSKARNPRIQNMLRMIGFGENLGSGFPKIIAAWKETNWGEPQLLNKVELDEVELVLPVPSLKTATANTLVNAPVNAPVKLKKTQSAIIKALLKDNRATYEDLAQTIGVDRTTVRRNIAILKEKGYIRRIGEDKNGHWEVLISIEDCSK